MAQYKVSEQQEKQKQIQTGYAPRRQHDLDFYKSEKISQAVPMATEAPKVNTIRGQKKSSEESSSELLSISPNAFDDSLKWTDKNGALMKSAVLTLREYLARHGLTPKYELVLPPNGEAIYCYRVSFVHNNLSYVAFGASRNQSGAKNCAAISLINKIISTQMPKSLLSTRTDVEDEAAAMAAAVSIAAATPNSYDCEEEIAPMRAKSKKGISSEFDSITKSVQMLSLEETLKMSNVNGGGRKTPVSTLQELLARRGIKPNYELITIEGTLHEPIFHYRVSFNHNDESFSAKGAGRSKKIALHAAANSLINKLKGVETPDDDVTSSDVGAAAVEYKTAEFGCANIPNIYGSGDGEEKISSNPVGILQEMCMQRHWPLPFYETELIIGPPHERRFAIVCILHNYREVGNGTSKKIAKRYAAQKMWLRVQDNPLNLSQLTETTVCDNGM